MAIVGPGANKQEVESPKATLDGASEYEYVTILNPLTDDFAVMVAQSRPVNLPFEVHKSSDRTQGVTSSESDVRQVYGLQLKNPDHAGKTHITNSTIIRSGKTINLKGDEAQVAVRQLVNEILQREGKSRLMADPNLRKEVEDRIIVNRGSVQDLMDNRLQSPQQQLNEAIKVSNEVQDEQEFPGLTDEHSGGSEDSSSEAGSRTESTDSNPTKTPKTRHGNRKSDPETTSKAA